MSAEQHVDLRKAVRLESKETFNGGTCTNPLVCFKIREPR